MMAEENVVPLATPTRFLIENGEWNLTPGLSIQPEMNPFDCNLNDSKHNDNHVVTERWSSTQSNSTSPILSNNDSFETTTIHSSHSNNQLTSPPTPPMTLSQSPSSTSTSFSVNEIHEEHHRQHFMYAQPPQQQEESLLQEPVRRSSRIQSKPQQVHNDYIQAMGNNNEQTQSVAQPLQPQQQRKPSASGRKRRIVFEGEDAEDRRKKFLERNRIAAYKCRQKKKNWMQDLEQKAEIQNIQNERLRAIVAQLKEESMYLKNLLLSHGNCDCESVQAYLRKTSMEITNNTSANTLLSTNNSHTSTIRRNSSYSTASYPTHITSNTSFPSTSTGLTPFLNTVINKPQMPEPDYFSHSHHTANLQQHILDNNNDIEA